MRQLLARTSWLTTWSLFALIFFAGNSSAIAAPFYGVTTTNQLVSFDNTRPSGPGGNVMTIGAITGLQPSENVVGIDFRPANGQLYALGSSSRLYTLNLTNGAATQVGAAGAFTLTGTNFGFDFNPVVDRIRVVSNTGQNIRINPNDGSLAATDTPLNPGAPNVTAAAYSNNIAGATTTTLYVIDTTTDTLYLQGSINGSPNSPNGGMLTPVGLLGVDASDVNGFDIASSDGTAYAALTVGGTTRIYTINLTTGAATSLGVLPSVTLSGLSVAFGTGAVGTAVLDYDGDRRTDFSVFRGNSSGNGTFYVRRSSDNGFSAVNFGLSSDVQTPGDYDGDGRTDYAVWRESNGTFYVLNSGTSAFQAVQFGQFGDEPVARDYDGDGKTDFAVVRRANGQMTWYIIQSVVIGNNVVTQQFGADTDTVAPGDYDGDGRFDLAVYRGVGNNPATFYVQRSTAGFIAVQFGIGSDLVVPGDYDGDGKYDFAVVRQGTAYTWYILGGANNFYRSVQFGAKPQLTAQGDYDGDGRTDIATWNPINGSFFIARTTAGAQQVQFGQNGDYPVANFDTH